MCFLTTGNISSKQSVTGNYQYTKQQKIAYFIAKKTRYTYQNSFANRPCAIQVRHIWLVWQTFSSRKAVFNKNSKVLVIMWLMNTFHAMHDGQLCIILQHCIDSSGVCQWVHCVLLLLQRPDSQKCCPQENCCYFPFVITQGVFTRHICFMQAA